MNEMISILIGWGLLLPLLVLRLLILPRYNSLWIVWVFWLGMMFSVSFLESYALLPGLACNSLAVLSNNGKMPVYFITTTNYSTHKLADNCTRFPYLCDRFSQLRFSVGDVLITIGLIIQLVIDQLPFAFKDHDFQ